MKEQHKGCLGILNEQLEELLRFRSKSDILKAEFDSFYSKLSKETVSTSLYFVSNIRSKIIHFQRGQINLRNHSLKLSNTTSKNSSARSPAWAARRHFREFLKVSKTWTSFYSRLCKTSLVRRITWKGQKLKRRRRSLVSTYLFDVCEGILLNNIFKKTFLIVKDSFFRIVRIYLWNNLRIHIIQSKSSMIRLISWC